MTTETLSKDNMDDVIQTTIPITGMTCAACAVRIEKGLNRMQGVSNATVNLALETAHVEFNPTEIAISDRQKGEHLKPSRN